MVQEEQHKQLVELLEAAVVDVVIQRERLALVEMAREVQLAVVAVAVATMVVVAEATTKEVAVDLLILEG
jgi:hypothetical protein